MNVSSIPGRTGMKPRPLTAGWLAALCVILGGCGAETYESRLEETRKYFEYLQNVNQVLTANAWSQFGIEFRVPKQFTLMPGPQTASGADGSSPETASGTNPDSRSATGQSGRVDGAPSVPTGPDPRQPRYLGVELPGLAGAWTATLPVDSGGQTADRPAYLYVCSNHSLWLQKEADSKVDPLLFFREFGTRLAQALNITPPSADYEWEWKRENIPAGKGYVPSKKYDSIIFELEMNGVQHDLMLFRHQARDIHVVILYVIPHGVDPRQRLTNAINYSLEHLEVSDRLPTTKPSSRPAGPRF
jgi:hypothetical protein